MKKKQKDCLKNFDFVIFQLKDNVLNIYKNINLLHELPFYDALSVKQISKVFKKYTQLKQQT